MSDDRTVIGTETHVAFTPAPASMDGFYSVADMLKHAIRSGTECCFPYKHEEHARMDIDNIMAEGFKPESVVRVTITLEHLA